MEQRLAGAIAAVRSSHNALQAAQAQSNHHSSVWTPDCTAHDRFQRTAAVKLSAEHLLPSGAQGGLQCSSAGQAQHACALGTAHRPAHSRGMADNDAEDADSLPQLWCGPQAPGSTLPGDVRTAQGGVLAHSSLSGCIVADKQQSDQSSQQAAKSEHAAAKHPVQPEHVNGSSVAQHALATAARPDGLQSTPLPDASARSSRIASQHAVAAVPEEAVQEGKLHAGVPAMNQNTVSSQSWAAHASSVAAKAVPLADSSNVAPQLGAVAAGWDVVRTSAEWVQVDERVQRLLGWAQ